MSVASLEVTVVVPAFNEEHRLKRSLPALHDAIDRFRTEVLVVDDGSRDGTAGVARECLDAFPRGRVIRLPANAGKGAATRVGVSRARGRSIVFMDADLAADPARLPALVSALRSADVAIGSRAVEGAVVEGASSGRVLRGRTFNRWCRLVAGLPFRDTQCGFKGFRGSAGKVLFHISRLNGFAFDVELLLLASKLGLSVHEVPVHWTAVEGSRVHPLRDPLAMTLDVLRSRFRWRGDRPLAAVAAACVGDEAPEVAAEVRARVRGVDPVVCWEGRAVALLPCTDRSGVGRVTARLRRTLPDRRVDAVEVPADVLDPWSGGLLRSALAA